MYHNELNDRREKNFDKSFEIDEDSTAEDSGSSKSLIDQVWGGFNSYFNDNGKLTENQPPSERSNLIKDPVRTACGTTITPGENGTIDVTTPTGEQLRINESGELVQIGPDGKESPVELLHESESYKGQHKTRRYANGFQIDQYLPMTGMIGGKELTPRGLEQVLTLPSGEMVPLRSDYIKRVETETRIQSFPRSVDDIWDFCPKSSRKYA